MTMTRQANTAQQRIPAWGRKLKNYFAVDKFRPECRSRLF
jgi:hypothetical protein